MAYRNRFVFEAGSDNGNHFEILIAQNGYTGDAVERNLGGSPTLRMESGGCIHGMSLEIPAECVTADEYADLYTSDPTKFKVTVYMNSAILWYGFITPELYSAPWVDPPHDVALTATDGLGELKRVTFEAIGTRTLEYHLTSLLANTGLSLDIALVSALQTDLSASPGNALSTTSVNLDHMAGQSCYDVLQAILESLHATIRQRAERWLVIRETDVADSVSGTNVLDTDSNSYAIIPFGSMNAEDVWPVGRLVSEIEPARNSIIVKSENHTIQEFLSDPDMSTGSWSGTGTHVSGDNPYYSLASGEYISQEVDIPEKPEYGHALDLLLTLRVRQADSENAHNVRVQVTAYGIRVGTSYSTFWCTETGWINVTAQEARYIDKEVKAYGSYDDCEDIQIKIPLSKLYGSLESLTTFTVKIASDDNTVYVHGANLAPVNDFSGVKTTVTIDNDARGAGDEVDCCFADTTTYNMGLQMQANALYGEHNGYTFLVEELESLSLSACDSGEFIAKDYAMSVANPRLRLRGVLNIPYGGMYGNIVFMSTDGMNFIAEEWSYTLLTDETDISLISLPATSLTVTDVTTERYTESSSSGGSSSGSGGGGGGGSTGATSLPELSDVDSDLSPSTGDHLYYDGTQWTNQSATDEGEEAQFVFCEASSRPTAPDGTTGLSWTASVDVSWITLSSSSGTGSDTITYTVAANSGSSSRTGVITVAYSGGSKTLTITQAAGSSSGGSISPTTKSVSASGATFSAYVTVPSGTSYRLLISNSNYDSDWNTIVSTINGESYNAQATQTGTGSQQEYVFVVNSNPLGTARTFTINVYISGSSYAATLTVTQSA